MTPARLLVAVVAALLLAPAAAPAVESARWLATFEARQTVEWEMPRQYGYEDCFSREWASGSGVETWSVRTRRPVRVLAYVWKPTRRVVIKYGTWDQDALGEDGLESGGLIERRGLLSHGLENGRCGAPGVDVRDPEPTDCGSRLPAYDVTFSHARRNRLFFATKHTGGETAYRTCPLVAVADYSDGGVAPGRATAAALLGRRALTVTGTASDSGVVVRHPGAIETTTTTRMRWTLKLTPGDAPARRPRGRRRGR